MSSPSVTLHRECATTRDERRIKARNCGMTIRISVARTLSAVPNNFAVV